MIVLVFIKKGVLCPIPFNQRVIKGAADLDEGTSAAFIVVVVVSVVVVMLVTICGTIPAH